ncbi:MAG: helix-turn-helix domain-containing protein [Myxococcota bacterium]
MNGWPPPSAGAMGLLHWRLRNRVDLPTVADAVDLSPEVWRMYELGRMMPPRYMAERLARLTGVPVSAWGRR